MQNTNSERTNNSLTFVITHVKLFSSKPKSIKLNHIVLLCALYTVCTKYSRNIKRKVINDREYTWFTTKFILQLIPILDGHNRRSLYRYLTALKDAGYIYLIHGYRPGTNFYGGYWIAIPDRVINAYKATASNSSGTDQPTPWDKTVSDIGDNLAHLSGTDLSPQNISIKNKKNKEGEKATATSFVNSEEEKIYPDYGSAVRAGGGLYYQDGFLERVRFVKDGNGNLSPVIFRYPGKFRSLRIQPEIKRTPDQTALTEPSPDDEIITPLDSPVNNDESFFDDFDDDERPF
jgi:hypothetical protein